VSVAQTLPATDPAQKEKKDFGQGWKPSPPDIPALEYGAALDVQASPALKRWVQAYARKHMAKNKINLAAVHAAVDARYSRASAAARDAVVYLLLYTAYKGHCKILAQTEEIAGLPISFEPFSGRAAPTGSAQPGPRPLERSATGEWIAPDRAPASNFWLFADNSMSNWLPPVAGADIRGVGAHLPRLRERVDVSQRMLSEAFQQMGATPPKVLRKIR
jgi:hypothetical protein